jgi:hypothetical protein
VTLSLQNRMGSDIIPSVGIMLGLGARRTSPRALMAQDSPSSPAAADADSDAFFASAAAAGAASATSDELDSDGAKTLIVALDGFGPVASGGIAGPTAVPVCGGCVAAGRRRWRISLALGPAAGTRSSVSRWRIRSALICGLLCWRGNSSLHSGLFW